MEIMPELSHGIAPVESVTEPSSVQRYLRTTEEDRHSNGNFVALGHSFYNDISPNDPRVFLPMKYIGPVFGSFHGQI
jgi:hypothetical protein